MRFLEEGTCLVLLGAGWHVQAYRPDCLFCLSLVFSYGPSRPLRSEPLSGKRTPAALEVATTGPTRAAQAQQSNKAATGAFTPDFRSLQSRGFTLSRDLVIEIVVVTESGFCLEARHVNDFERVYSFDSATNRVEVSPCG